jgi:low temperature requirement protein LtrA
MALSVTSAYGDRGLVFACAYWAARLSLGIRLSHSPFVLNPFTVSVFCTGPLLIVGSLLDAGPREAIWGIAAVVDLSSPTVLRSRLRLMHFDAGHLTERCALFVLIAVGLTQTIARWMMFHLASSTRVIGALVVLAVMPVAPHITALAATAVLALLLVALNVVEYQRVPRAAERAS